MRKRRSQTALRLDQVQSLSLAELGEHLRQCRAQKGLSLEQIAASTKIQRRLLQAIEEGQMEVLPESVYIRGLIRRFAEALDLPGADVAQRFPLETGASNPNFWSRWNGGQLQPIHLYFLYVFLIFSAVNGLSVLMNRSVPSSASSLPLELELPERSPAPGQPLSGNTLGNTSGNKPDNRSGNASGNSSGDASGNKLRTKDFASSSALKSAFPLINALTLDPIVHLKSYQSSLQRLPTPVTVAPDKPVQVLVSIKEQSWMRVTVDEENSFEGILAAGAQRTWAGKSKVTIRAGNAGGVLVAFNNEQPHPLGEAGAVEEVSFSSTKPE